MTRRYPRITPIRAKEAISRLPLDLDALSSLPVPELSSCRFAPTGGPKVARPELLQLKEALIAEARAAGYPERSSAAKQAFDRRAAVLLAGTSLPLGEMLRSDVWSWLCIHLVPALVSWRFGSEGSIGSAERFTGILQRNTLGRLWLRGKIFDRGEGEGDRWGLVSALSEDASVAILERTGISGDWRLARVLGERWLESRQKGERADALIREAGKRILVEKVVVETGILDDEMLKQFVERVFSGVGARLQEAIEQE